MFRRTKLLELPKINLQGVERVFLLTNRVSFPRAQAMESILNLGVKRITTVACPEEINRLFLEFRQKPFHEQIKVKFIKIDENDELVEMFSKGRKGK